MNLKETAQFLAVVSSIDNRRADKNVAVVWQEILHDIPLRFAMTAHTEFRRESPGVYLEPGHIYQRGKQLRDRNRMTVASGKALGLIDESADDDTILPGEAAVIIGQYAHMNDRAMMGVISNDDARRQFDTLRDRWVAVGGTLSPKSVES